MRRISSVLVIVLALGATTLPAASTVQASLSPGDLNAGTLPAGGDGDGSPGDGFSPFPGLGAAADAVEYVPGEIVVQYRKGVSAADQLRARGRTNVQLLERVPGMRVEHLRVRPGTSVDTAIGQLLKDPSVLAAEPNHRLQPHAVPNDLVTEQWYLSNLGQAHPISDPGFPFGAVFAKPGADVDAPDAWDDQTGKPAVKIAVIDTGVSTTHPDLAAALVDGRNFASGPANNPNPDLTKENQEHGTHVAGIAAAVTNNGYGIAGACPECKIIPIRFAFSLASEIKAIDWAIKKKANVINASYGGAPWSLIERNAIKKAGKKKILFVSSAGNNHADNDVATFLDKKMRSPNFPASYGLPNILAVAATNSLDEYGYFTGCVINLGNTKTQCAMTNVGRTTVDVGAPGIDIVSTVPAFTGTLGPSFDFDTYNGTSMASPLVAGIAGLVKSHKPGWSPVKIKHAIMNSTDKPNALKKYLGGKGKFTVTNGRVNMHKALSGKTKGFKLGDGTIEGAKKMGTTKSGTVKWPEKPNTIFKKSLKKGVTYRMTVKASGTPVQASAWGPGTIDLWQLQAGCLGGSGDCTLRAYFGVGKNKTASQTFKATKGGMHYFQITSFYRTKKATGKVTVRPA